MKISGRSFTALLFLCVVAGCGGGGSSALPAPLLEAGPAATALAANPDVDPSDTAENWTSARYDLSGSGDNALQTAITEANVGTLSPAWIFKGTVGSLSSVAVSDGFVYRTEEGSNVYAIDESTGAQIWNFNPPTPEGFNASPLVADGLIYLFSSTGRSFAIGAESGQLSFAYPAQSAWGPLVNGGQNRAHYRGSPVYTNGTVYEGASNYWEPSDCMQGGQVLALDPLSSSTRNVAYLTPNDTNGVGVWTSPVFDSVGDMFVATGNSCSFTDAPYGDSMLRLDPNTFSVDWSTPGPPDENDLDFGATPVVVDDEVIDGGKDGYVYAYDAGSGQLLWKQSPYPANGIVLGALATDGRYVAVPYALSTDNEHAGIAVYDLQGNLVWSLVTGIDATQGKGVLSPPAISQGMLFVGYTKANCTSNCDGLGAFDLATGKSLWFYSTPTPVFGGIVVVQGGVFASEEGNATLYCFQPTTPSSPKAAPRIIYGTRGSPAFFHDPWLHSNDVNGDNAGRYY